MRQKHSFFALFLSSTVSCTVAVFVPNQQRILVSLLLLLKDQVHIYFVKTFPLLDLGSSCTAFISTHCVSNLLVTLMLLLSTIVALFKSKLGFI